jgi:hypothetical protein
MTAGAGAADRAVLCTTGKVAGTTGRAETAAVAAAQCTGSNLCLAALLPAIGIRCTAIKSIQLEDLRCNMQNSKQLF